MCGTPASQQASPMPPLHTPLCVPGARHGGRSRARQLPAAPGRPHERTKQPGPPPPHLPLPSLPSFPEQIPPPLSMPSPLVRRQQRCLLFIDGQRRREQRCWAGVWGEGTHGGVEAGAAGRGVAEGQHRKKEPGRHMARQREGGGLSDTGRGGGRYRLAWHWSLC